MMNTLRSVCRLPGVASYQRSILITGPQAWVNQSIVLILDLSLYMHR